MTDLAIPDLATAIPNAIAKLKALDPIADELEAFKANLAAAKAALKEAKDEFAAIAAERDRARADYAAARAELIVIQGALAAAYKQHEVLERQIKQMERKV